MSAPDDTAKALQENSVAARPTRRAAAPPRKPTLSGFVDFATATKTVGRRAASMSSLSGSSSRSSVASPAWALAWASRMRSSISSSVGGTGSSMTKSFQSSASAGFFPKRPTQTSSASFAVFVRTLPRKMAPAAQESTALQ